MNKSLLIYCGIGALAWQAISPAPATAQICKYLWESACNDADAFERIKFKKPCGYLFPGACKVADDSEKMMDLVINDIETIWLEHRDAAIDSIEMTWLARRAELLDQAEAAWLDTRNELIEIIEDEIGITADDLILAKELWAQAKGGLAILEKGLPGIQKEFSGRIRACINKGIAACTEDIKVGIKSGGYVYACVSGDYSSCYQALKLAQVSPSRQAPWDPTAGYFPPKANTIFEPPSKANRRSLISATFIPHYSNESIVEVLTLQKQNNPYNANYLPYPNSSQCPYYNAKWRDGVWSAYAFCRMNNGRGKATVYSRNANGGLVYYKFASYSVKNNNTTVYGYKGDVTKFFNFTP